MVSKGSSKNSPFHHNLVKTFWWIVHQTVCVSAGIFSRFDTAVNFPKSIYFKRKEKQFQISSESDPPGRWNERTSTTKRQSFATFARIIAPAVRLFGRITANISTIINPSSPKITRLWFGLSVIEYFHFNCADGICVSLHFWYLMNCRVCIELELFWKSKKKC